MGFNNSMDLKIGCVLSGGNVDDDVYCNLVGL